MRTSSERNLRLQSIPRSQEHRLGKSGHKIPRYPQAFPGASPAKRRGTSSIKQGLPTQA